LGFFPINLKNKLKSFQHSITNQNKFLIL